MRKASNSLIDDIRDVCKGSMTSEQLISTESATYKPTLINSTSTNKGKGRGFPSLQLLTQSANRDHPGKGDNKDLIKNKSRGGVKGIMKSRRKGHIAPKTTTNDPYPDQRQDIQYLLSFFSLRAAPGPRASPPHTTTKTRNYRQCHHRYSQDEKLNKTTRLGLKTKVGSLSKSTFIHNAKMNTIEESPKLVLPDEDCAGAGTEDDSWLPGCGGGGGGVYGEEEKIEHELSTSTSRCDNMSPVLTKNSDKPMYVDYKHLETESSLPIASTSTPQRKGVSTMRCLVAVEAVEKKQQQKEESFSSSLIDEDAKNTTIDASISSRNHPDDEVELTGIPSSITSSITDEAEYDERHLARFREEAEEFVYNCYRRR